MEDTRLDKIREKDPIIATYRISTLSTASKIIDETYSEHALTHISIGNTSDYLQNLLKWIRTNKGCVAGAIVGPIGYGKTSTAIHFWKKCEEAKIVAVPPVSWQNLEELLDGVYGWTKYKLEKRAPSFTSKLDKICKKYQKKSLEEISRTRSIPLDELIKMHKSGELILGYRPKEIIDYLEEVTNLLLAAEFEGLMLFLDELQITLEGYPTRDKFMNDIFMLVNELLTRKGKYGILFCMPTNTETLIADIRKDIIQRLQSCNLFIRADTIYDRKFPSELWRKYAYLYEFEDSKSNIIPEDTCDAIGQISSREDLGAGPRTVIDAFIQAVNHYNTSRQPYTPSHLIDDYLNKKIAFVAGGKLTSAVSDAINIPFVQQKKERIEAMKLLSAYPRGCPDHIIRSYRLESTFDELIKELYGEVLMKSVEGYTLRKLLEADIPAEPHFIRLTKDFVNRYCEDAEHAGMAREAFIENIADSIFEKKRAQQIKGWSLESETRTNDHTILRKLKGTFNERFPFREFNLMISSSRNIPDIKEDLDGLTLVLHLDWNCEREYSGNIEFDKELSNKVIARLNLIQYPMEDLNIPYLNQFFPMDKVSPMFMLSLLCDLQKNIENIPTHEVETDLKVFTDRLVTFSNQMLLSDNLREASKLPLEFVGRKLIEEIFNCLCKQLYPEYETFITSPKWQQYFKSYIAALKDERIGLRVARGSTFLQRSPEEIANIFGTPSVLAFKTLAANITQVLKIEEWKEYGKIKFLYHPLEEKILYWIRSSNDEIKKKGNMLPCLFWGDIFERAQRLGYVKDEILQALELLKSRMHIDLDMKEKRVYEFPVSIEEHKDLLIGKVNELQKNVETLTKIAGFNKSLYEQKIAKITKKIDEQIENIEDCENIKEEINAQFRNINGFVQKKDGGVTSELGDLLAKIQLILSRPVPNRLIQSIEAEVPWVADLNEMRHMILKKYNLVINNLRKLSTTIQQLLDNRRTERFDLETFLGFYDTYLEIKNEYKDRDEELITSRNYFTKFESWLSLLRNASDNFSRAQGCKEYYNYPEFLEKLEKIFDDIRQNFKDKKLEGLTDYEIFSRDVDKIGKDLEEWQRKQRQTFLSKKEEYEERIRKLQVSEPMLRQNFDTYDPSGSFEKLYQEAYEKVKQKLDDVRRQVNHFENEIVYSIRILEEDLAELKEQMDRIKTQFQNAKKHFSSKMIKDSDEFGHFCTQVTHLNDLILAIEKDLRGTITKKSVTKEEQEIVRLIKDPAGEDLKNVIIQFAEKNPERFDLSSILSLIENLFRKNQIIVKIILRR